MPAFLYLNLVMFCVFLLSPIFYCLSQMKIFCISRPSMVIHALSSNEIKSSVTFQMLSSLTKFQKSKTWDVHFLLLRIPWVVYDNVEVLFLTIFLRFLTSVLLSLVTFFTRPPLTRYKKRDETNLEIFWLFEYMLNEWSHYTLVLKPNTNTYLGSQNRHHIMLRVNLDLATGHTKTNSYWHTNRDIGSNTFYNLW